MRHTRTQSPIAAFTVAKSVTERPTHLVYSYEPIQTKHTLHPLASSFQRLNPRWTAENPLELGSSTKYDSLTMTTNLNAIAGPSKLSPHPRIDPDSPSSTGSDTKDHLRAFVSPEHEEAKVTSSGSILKGGMAVDENGEMVKVPAFLQKLYT